MTNRVFLTTLTGIAAMQVIATVIILWMGQR